MPAKMEVPEALRPFLGNPTARRDSDALIVSAMLRKIGVERSVPFESSAIREGALEVIAAIDGHLKGNLAYPHKRGSVENVGCCG